MYPTETDKKTTTSITVERTVDRVSELLRVRCCCVDELNPSIALAAAAAAEDSISRLYLILSATTSALAAVGVQVNGA